MEYKRKFISQAYDRPGTVLNDLNWLADFLMHVTPGEGGGGYSQKIGWDVRPASQNGQNRYPINDQNG